jgi:ArsR family transcriptional regulator, lead/cadmium/zinc/bismuth-responsive transcriptional repressor
MKRLPSTQVRTRTLSLFRAIGHRDRLLVLLALAETDRLCVSDLVELCGTTQSAMSHQLRTLRNAGLVKTERQGKQIFYALDDRHVASIIQDAVAHVAEQPRRRSPA